MKFLGLLLTFAALFGLALLFAMNCSGAEAVLAAACAVIALWCEWAFVRAADLSFRFPPRAALQVWRLPGYAVTGTWELWRALARQLFTRAGADNHLAAAEYAPISERPDAAGMRALAVTYVTSTPNFVVLGILRQEGVMLYHQVLKGPVIELARKLGGSAEGCAVREEEK